jgi:hypothetical protein
MTDLSTSHWLYFVFPILYVLHLLEEYGTGFTRKFAPPRWAGPTADRAFWIGNSLFLGVVTAVGVAQLVKPHRVFIWAVACGSIFAWNGVFHAIWAAATRRYQPGLITGLLYVPVLGIWLRVATVSADVVSHTVQLGILIGLIVMVALVGCVAIAREKWK